MMPTLPLLEKFEDMGAGLYAETDDEDFRIINEPKLQKPHENWRNELISRFIRIVFPTTYARTRRRLKQIDAIANNIEPLLKAIRKQESSPQQQILSQYWG